MMASAKPEGRAIIDTLFDKYALPLPDVAVFDGNSEIDLEFMAQWGYNANNIYLEFSWSRSGYSWCGHIVDEHFGSKRYSDNPVPPEADEFIRKIFPQTPEELSAAIFDEEVLARVVQYYSR